MFRNTGFGIFFNNLIIIVMIVKIIKTMKLHVLKINDFISY
jgi:hypothetical protein